MRSLDVRLPGNFYPILVGSGARHELPRVISELAPSQIAVVTDATVHGLHRSAIEAELGPRPARWVVLPAGEASKSLAVLERIYDELAAARLERDGLVLALGGGVVGDVAGFAAATWLRGVRFVQLPTTVEAAVDASVGGKTGINHPLGKNLIGAFHQPSAVVIDVDFLSTLPQRDAIAGLGECVKHAALRGEDEIAWLESNAAAVIGRDPAAMAELIARNCQIKADVVAADERERDRRAILNYGHTLGHALEHVMGYELRHGECVALGILAENRIAVARGVLTAALAGRIGALIERLGLPTRLTRPVDSDAVLAACRLDKKNRGGAVTLMLLHAAGRCERAADIRDEEIVAAMESIAVRA